MHPKLLNSGLCIYKILQIIVNNKNRMSNYANVLIVFKMWFN